MTDYRFDAYLVHDQATGGPLAKELKRRLQRVTAGQTSRGRLRLFSDNSTLPKANLWDEYEAAMTRSRCLLFLASPPAARSAWVNRELQFWRDRRERSSFYILLAGGEIAWSTQDHEFDWRRTTAIPPSIWSWFNDEPFCFDLRHVTVGQSEASPWNNDKLDEVTYEIAAALYGLDKEHVRGVARARLLTSRSALRNELRIRETQLRDQAERLHRQEARLQQQALRLKELAAFDQKAEIRGGVFISYSHADSDVVDDLAARFDSDRINYWRDEKNLLVGDVIDKAVSRGIQQSILFLIVLTPTSIKSRWVERELDEAAHEETEGGKIVLPVVAKGLRHDEIPSRLRRKLYVDVSEQTFESGYARLVFSIRQHLRNVNSPDQGS